MAHAFRQIEEHLFRVPSGYNGHSAAYRRADLIGSAEGSVHMGFYMSDLQPKGNVDTCVHSFEKAIFVMDGELELNRDGMAFRLVQNDYALVPIGTPYALRNRSSQPVRWVEKCGPRPKNIDEWQDSFFSRQIAWPNDADIQSAKTPLARMVGHFDKSQLPPPSNGDEHISGFSRKMLMDRMFGSQQFDLFIIEFTKGGKTTLHDHNFEEVYLALDGKAKFIAEGAEYILKPGTVAWSGTGAPHGFLLDQGSSCCWLEAMSPQPPVQNIGRRFAIWEKLRKELEI